IKFTFISMDSEPNVDFVYLVDGRTAIPANFIAKFSGQNLPPIVYSKTNEVLIWFVTDKANSGQGWQFHYETVK
ncbi:MAG: CUB domain-containing protein, partial [Cyclobacteriaceae bacterium]|nr:CUB domain-containing protein [Cyclobacteriaceae bacterium]